MIQSIDNVLLELSLNDLTPSIQRMILKNYVESIIDECAKAATAYVDEKHSIIAEIKEIKEEL